MILQLDNSKGMIFVLTKQKLVAWDDLQFDTGRDQIDRDRECVWESDIHTVVHAESEVQAQLYVIVL